MRAHFAAARLETAAPTAGRSAIIPGVRRLLAAALLLLALVAVLGHPSPARAQEATQQVTWERFDVNLELLPDGTLRVVQTERIRFNGSFQRAFREIPLDRVTSITEVQVGEPGRDYRPGYNQPETYAVTRSNDRVRIDWWFPRTTNDVRTFVIRYRVTGAIRVYPDGDQVYWTAVPADRPGSVQEASATLTLPEAVAPDQLRAAAYVGGRELVGATAISANAITYRAANVPAGQAFEVRLQYPHGLVAATPPAWQAAYDRQAAYDTRVRPLLNLLMLLVGAGGLVGGLVGIWLRWYVGGRDPTAGPQPSVLEQPPSELPPGLAGLVVDEEADVQDVLATLIDLSNRGILRITRVQRAGGPDYRLELLRPQPLGLRGFERTVIGALFRGQREVYLSEIRDRWLGGMELFKAQLYQEAVERGLFYENPQTVRTRWRRGGLLALATAVVGGALATTLLGRWVDLIWLPFLALGLLGIAALWAARRMPRRTRAGVLEAAGWRAFGRYLASPQHLDDDAALDRLARYLPYAIALGVDRSWLERFQRVLSPPAPVAAPGGPVVIVGPGGWGFPGYYGPPPFGGPWTAGGGHEGRGRAAPPNPDQASGGLSGGLDSASDSLADLLNAASDALSGGGWSGGGGGGGGSGGGSAGFG